MKRDTEFLYFKLANNLRQQILSGFIKPGEFLLSENELVKHYGLSRVSIRKALDILADEGFIIKKHGQGTMVSTDLTLNQEPNQTLNILTTSPSFFADNSLPLIIEEFKKKHPNVNVRVLNIPIISFWKSIQEFENSGLHPDLLLVTDQDIKDMEYEGSFLDLQEPLKDYKSKMYSKLLDPFHLDGTIQAAPVTFSTIYLAYNPNLFHKYKVAEPDEMWTKTDFMNTARQFTMDTNGDGIVDQYGFSMFSSLTRWLIFALQNGVDFNNISNSTQALMNTFTFIHDLLYRERIAIQHNVSTTYTHPFLYEKSAMTLTSSLELAGWKKRNLGFEPKVAPLPFGDINATIIISNLFMVPSTTSYPELAYSFVNTALSNEVQERILLTNSFPSVLKSVNEKVWNKSYLKALNITTKDLQNSFFLHDIFPQSIVTSDIGVEMEMFWAGLESAESISNRFQEIMSNSEK